MANDVLEFNIGDETFPVKVTPRLMIAFEDEFDRSVSVLGSDAPKIGDVFRMGYVGVKTQHGYAGTWDQFQDEATINVEVDEEPPEAPAEA